MLPISVKVKAHTKMNNSQKMPSVIFIPDRQQSLRFCLQVSKSPLWLRNFLQKSKRQSRKGKIYLSECSIPKNSKERSEILPKWTMQRNRMGKTRDLFKKIRNYGHNKGQKWYEPSRTKIINQRWQENTKLLFQDLHDQNTTMVWSLT